MKNNKTSVCKICNKSFPFEKSLGGHMRSHYEPHALLPKPTIGNAGAESSSSRRPKAEHLGDVMTAAAEQLAGSTTDPEVENAALILMSLSRPENQDGFVLIKDPELWVEL